MSSLMQSQMAENPHQQKNPIKLTAKFLASFVEMCQAARKGTQSFDRFPILWSQRKMCYMNVHIHQVLEGVKPEHETLLKFGYITGGSGKANYVQTTHLQ